MGLVRTWVRKLLAVSGVALAVPLSVAAALSVLAFAGDFGSLGSLRQIFSGPRLPGPGATATVRNVAVAAAVVPSRTTGLPAPRSRVTRRAARVVTAAPAYSAPVAQVAPAPVSAGHIPPSAGAAPVRPSRPVASSAPAAPPAPEPSNPTTLAQQLPAPVGPAASGALQAIGSAIPPVRTP